MPTKLGMGVTKGSWRLGSPRQHPRGGLCTDSSGGKTSKWILVGGSLSARRGQDRSSGFLLALRWRRRKSLQKLGASSAARGRGVPLGAAGAGRPPWRTPHDGPEGPRQGHGARDRIIARCTALAWGEGREGYAQQNKQ